MRTSVALCFGVAVLACGHAPPSTQGGVVATPSDRAAQAHAVPASANTAAPDVDTGRPATPNAVYFRLDEALLTVDARPILERVAQRLKNDPGARLRIEGNCDERGTTEYNLALGEKRARAAREHLIRLGVSPGRIEVSSYGSERPRKPGHDEDAWSENRRDDFVIR